MPDKKTELEVITEVMVSACAGNAEKVPKAMALAKKIARALSDNRKSSRKPRTVKKQGDFDPFEHFYALYPRKKSPGDARKAWNAKCSDPAIHEAVFNGLARAKKSHQWLKEGGKYIPYPASWLRGEGWKDEDIEARVCPDCPHLTSEHRAERGRNETWVICEVGDCECIKSSRVKGEAPKLNQTWVALKAGLNGTPHTVHETDKLVAWCDGSDLDPKSVDWPAELNRIRGEEAKEEPCDNL